MLVQADTYFIVPHVCLWHDGTTAYRPQCKHLTFLASCFPAQPQRSPSEPGQRDASRCHNGLRYNTVSTSKQSPSDQDAQPGADDANAPAEHTMVPPMCTCGANFAPNGENGGQTPGVRPTSEQPRRQPSMPVSQKMTRKLRSSLSVNSDSSSSQKPPLPEGE